MWLTNATACQNPKWVTNLQNLGTGVRYKPVCIFKAPFTGRQCRRRVSTATGNTWQATRAFTRSTVDVKSPVDRNAVAFPLLSPEGRETEGRQQNHAAICELSDGRQSAWRLQAYTCDLSQRICKLSCI
jgi:hypothetical protein